MIYFLNSYVETHTEDTLQSLFHEEEKNVILGYSMVSGRSPPVTRCRIVMAEGQMPDVQLTLR